LVGLYARSYVNYIGKLLNTSESKYKKLNNFSITSSSTRCTLLTKLFFSFAKKVLLLFDNYIRFIYFASLYLLSAFSIDYSSLLLSITLYLKICASYWYTKGSVRRKSSSAVMSISSRRSGVREAMKVALSISAGCPLC
jgi:hypothetical protein